MRMTIWLVLLLGFMLMFAGCGDDDDDNDEIQSDDDDTADDDTYCVLS